ncbi:MAG: hypothetical protein [Circoviridae sp.]|nr:MAG: hypothetical protein [Circoviridae sp.]
MSTILASGPPSGVVLIDPATGLPYPEPTVPSTSGGFSFTQFKMAKRYTDFRGKKRVYSTGSKSLKMPGYQRFKSYGPNLASSRTRALANLSNKLKRMSSFRRSAMSWKTNPKFFGVKKNTRNFYRKMR